MATCRSCDAEIEWASWEASGKAVPLDVGAVDNGNLVCISGKVRVYTDADARVHRPRRRSHFASCPDAASHRRGKK